MCPGRSTGKHERLVLDRPRLGQQRPVRPAALRPARRDDQGLGAGVDETAEEFGETEVVAGGDATVVSGSRTVTSSRPAPISTASPLSKPKRWILR